SARAGRLALPRGASAGDDVRGPGPPARRLRILPRRRAPRDGAHDRRGAAEGRLGAARGGGRGRAGAEQAAVWPQLFLMYYYSLEDANGERRETGAGAQALREAADQAFSAASGRGGPRQLQDRRLEQRPRPEQLLQRRLLPNAWLIDDPSDRRDHHRDLLG